MEGIVPHQHLAARPQLNLFISFLQVGFDHPFTTQTKLLNVSRISKRRCLACHPAFSVGSVLDQCGINVGSVRDQCGISVGSVWDQCGISSVGSMWDQCGISVSAVWDQRCVWDHNLINVNRASCLTHTIFKTNQFSVLSVRSVDKTLRVYIRRAHSQPAAQASLGSETSLSCSTLRCSSARKDSLRGRRIRILSFGAQRWLTSSSG